MAGPLVVERRWRFAIVGTGPSIEPHIRDLNMMPNHVAVIAVNGAIDWLPRADYFFTLDPSPVNVERMRNQRRGCKYYAALPVDGDAAKHRGELQARGVRILRRIHGEGHGRLRTRERLPERRDEIHTGNSAWGALQLAIHMGAKRIALLGIDGHGGYVDTSGSPRDLSPMPGLFASAVDALRARRIEVRCGSPESTVTCFENCGQWEALHWLTT